MKKNIISNLIQGLKMTLLLLVLCGLIYPAVVSGLGGVIFPAQAKGNIINYDNKGIGSKYVGQEFTKDYFMWGRPSAVHYNVYYEKDGKQVYSDNTEFGGVSSGSENYANSNPEFKKRVDEYLKYFLEKNPKVKVSDIPSDLVTSSGSGLDPNISVQAAYIQVPRIAKASKLSEDEIKKFIKENTEGKLFNIFGTTKVNVLGVNLEIAKAMGQLK